MRSFLAVLFAAWLAACNNPPSNPDGGVLPPLDASAVAADTGTTPKDGGTIATADAGTSGPDAGSAGTIAIGEWTDAPGACPAGMTKVDVTTVAQLASATRGEDAYASDAPATCYFIHDGQYVQSTGVVFYVTKGGVAGGARRTFVGQSRSGVVIKGRASIDDGIGDVTISNLTFDLTGYAGTGSFNTLSLGNGANVTVDHVTFTGDCATGLKGGHVETNGTKNALVDSCLIEKFGHCSGGGHEDHGIYLASGSDLTIRNCVIRQNSSRGIQLYTSSGSYGRLDRVVIENNRIYENGHADYEDGIVMNDGGSKTIDDVKIRRNLLYRNYYSGLRFAGGGQTGVKVENNTFDHNGAGSTAAGRSEINLDDAGAGADTSVSKNLFAVGVTLINDCYDAAALGLSISDNFVQGAVPSGAAGNCIQGSTAGDPQFANMAAGDYRPQNAAASGFGAYAP